ncbi:MerR family transcriptional regulator [Bacteroides propionicifaciens]|jgi:DNA-binding transcriptional MerR regulator|uniref:MerR family transcriptional regulator n=1 Tax=Bacteroides propionicifaciens TaxID=392838 RepID=UPI00037FB162|nr:MerR family transcriptional regulator [Bacteroides propionicifaciens]
MDDSMLKEIPQESENEITARVKEELEKDDFKLYHSIGEVAKMFEVNESLLRYWERKFPILRPKTNKGGTRFYTKADIKNVGLIYQLVKVKGMTLAGAKNKLAQNPQETLSAYDMLKHLKTIRQELVAMRQELDRP